MHGTTPKATTPGATPAARTEPIWVQRILIGLALGFLGLFLLIPLVAVFGFALSRGLGTYGATRRTPQEIRESRVPHRSPLLLRCIEDHLAGRRFPLDAVFADPSLLHPESKLPD